MASAMLWMRHPSDTFGVIGLALNACDERSNGHREATEQIRELLVATRDLEARRRSPADDEASGAARSAARSASSTSRASWR